MKPPCKPEEHPAMQTDNLVTLKEYIDLRIDTLCNYTEVKLDAIDKATTLASDNMGDRLASMNEFRAQLKDQSATFIPRNEYLMAHDRLIADVAQLKEFRAELKGKASQQSVTIAYILTAFSITTAILGLIAGIIGVVLKFY